MSWDTGAPVSNTPTEYIADRIKNNIGIGSAPLRNWSFVENVAEGTCTAEKQRLTLATWGAGDHFHITFNGHETTNIDYASDIATAMQSALNALVDFNTLNTNVTVTRIDANTYDISNATTTKWHGVAFSLVGSFSVTGETGCTGSFAQNTAPVMKSGSANYSVDVFKCSGSGDDANDAGQDFYIFIARDKTAAATGWQINLAREWDTNYKKARYIWDRYSGNQTSTFAAVDANGWSYNATTPGYYYLPSNILSGNYHAFWKWTLNKSGFTYQIKMTKNFIVISTRVGTTDTCIYLGLMDSIISGATDTYPLVGICGLPCEGSGAYGLFLTLPGLGAIGTGVSYCFAAYVAGWTHAANLAVTNATNVFDKWANSGIWVARVFMFHGVSSANHYLWGKVRGLLKSDVLCFYVGGTVNIGDTMTIDGTTYTVLGPVSNNPTYYLVTQAN